MSHTSQPSADDVKKLIDGTGLFPSLDVAPFTSIDWDGAASAAYEQFKSKTGREFVVTEATTRVYDPPRHPKGILMLGADLASDPAATISVTISGVAKVANQDYYLGPDNSDQKGKPWGWIEIPACAITWVNGNPRKSIAITGYWGYSREMPDDVFDAIVGYAFYLCRPQLAANINNGLASIQDINYAQGGYVTLGPEAQQFAEVFQQTANRYRRVLTY
jgi:hypothetical protein